MGALLPLPAAQQCFVWLLGGARRGAEVEVLWSAWSVFSRKQGRQLDVPPLRQRRGCLVSFDKEKSFGALKKKKRNNYDSTFPSC